MAKQNVIEENVFERERQHVEQLLATKIIKSIPLKGGNNSRVYCLENEEGSKLVAKFYHRSVSDQRNRLAVEFSAFEYLKRNDITVVPRSIKRDDQHGIGIYEYIPGKKIYREDLTKEDLDHAVNFLLRLNELAQSENEQMFSNASEAKFSFDEVVKNIEFRLSRFETIKGERAIDRELKAFLQEDFVPVKNEIVDFIKHEVGVEYKRPLSLHEKTLSPSDFGFHNALRSGEEIIFFDFEYFGWDDPAKMVSDFLWHPAMDLLSWQNEYFYQKLVAGWSDPTWLKRRVKYIFPLFGLKWCMIILNEFLKDDAARRSFASGQLKDTNETLNVQLAKAKHYLSSIKKCYRDFPYEK